MSFEEAEDPAVPPFLLLLMHFQEHQVFHQLQYFRLDLQLLVHPHNDPMIRAWPITIPVCS